MALVLIALDLLLTKTVRVGVYTMYEDERLLGSDTTV